MFSRLYARIAQWLITNAVSEHFRFRCIDGPWWTLHLIGGSEQTEEAVKQDLLRTPPAKIEQLARADFPLAQRTLSKVLMLHVPSDIGMRTFNETLGVGLIRGLPCVGLEGFYAPAARLGIITGLTGSCDFRDSLLHEFSHAYCHLALGARSRVLWALEGYVELLVGRVVAMCGDATPPNLRCHLESVVGLIESHRLFPSIEVMRIRQSPRLFVDYPGFQAHSAMLMYMFALAGRHNPELLDICKRAVTGRGANRDGIMHAIEKCTDTPIPRLHERFVEFCKALIENVLPQPRIQSPETMFSVPGGGMVHACVDMGRSGHGGDGGDAG